MTPKILLISGGREEAEVGSISANYVINLFNKKEGFDLTHVFYSKNRRFYLNAIKESEVDEKKEITLHKNGYRLCGKNHQIDYCIPMIHGFPGESGDIQPILEHFSIQYLGNNGEVSNRCFNKITTKLWVEQLGIKTTPFKVIWPHDTQKDIVKYFRNFEQDVYIKASSQGSSIGCYHLTNEKKIHETIELARTFSDHILIEKAINARELEVAVFEYKNKTIVSNPGEVLNESRFYDFDAKYSNTSTSRTTLEPNLSAEQLEKIKIFSKKIFKGLNLRDLSRIDFFLSSNGEIYLNEVNTLPGMTPISLFPKLLESTGVSFFDYITDRIINRRLSK